MRSTVDLAPATAARVAALARERKMSKSATLAELVTIGLNHVEEPTRYQIDPLTGFAVFSTGTKISSDDVAKLIDEDEDE